MEKVSLSGTQNHSTSHTVKRLIHKIIWRRLKADTIGSWPRGGNKNQRQGTFKVTADGAMVLQPWHQSSNGADIVIKKFAPTDHGVQKLMNRQIILDTETGTYTVSL